jgi:hypothetical protein
MHHIHSANSPRLLLLDPVVVILLLVVFLLRRRRIPDLRGAQTLRLQQHFLALPLDAVGPPVDSVHPLLEHPQVLVHRRVDLLRRALVLHGRAHVREHIVLLLQPQHDLYRVHIEVVLVLALEQRGVEAGERLVGVVAEGLVVEGGTFHRSRRN